MIGFGSFGWGDVKNESLFGHGWYDPKSAPLKTLVEQKTVTLNSFFTKLGKFFLGLK